MFPGNSERGKPFPIPRRLGGRLVSFRHDPRQRPSTPLPRFRAAMSGPLLLGGRAYARVQDLEVQGADGARWALVQAEGEEARFLLQVWEPLPPPGALDRLREVYLQRFLDADPLDPPGGRFGFNTHRAWFLQPLVGQPLAEAWPAWDEARRMAFRRQVQAHLTRHPTPRLVHPGAIGILQGGFRIPRVLGLPPLSLSQALEALESIPLGTEAGPGPWEAPPEDLDGHSRPIRGRSQELTYLKSLALGLNAPAPMERMVVLMGEEGLGQEALADWFMASVETEGLWPHALELQHEEPAGAFLGRLLQTLVQGYEADLYARHPEATRLLARRLPSFAFLRAGRRVDDTAPLEPGELQAAITVLEFAQGLHPRLLAVQALERADEALQKALVELFLGTDQPWLLTCVPAGAGPRAFLGALRGNPSVAFVNLNRLEDGDQIRVLEDILGRHALPGPYLQQLLQASLGNPGLLARLLEAAQLEGSLVWAEGQWRLAPGSTPAPRLHEDLLDRILAGRLQRQGGAVLSVVRALALADHPLSVAALGRALGISGDPLDDALRSAAIARLVHLQDGRAALAEPRLRTLAADTTPPGEARRLARALLKALQEEAGRPVLSIPLQTLASGRDAALTHLLEALPDEPPPPAEADRLVHQALTLDPGPVQRARLWEFLADAWTLATRSGRAPEGTFAQRSPFEFALEALGLALVALEEAPASSPQRREQGVRILRKRALIRVRLRNLPEALKDLQAAAGHLGDQPDHPEQPRLHLALGMVHLLQGFQGKGIRALEEGLQLLAPERPRSPHGDQIALLIELGRAQGQKAQFQRAMATLQGAQRLLEHDQDLARLSELDTSLAYLHLAVGQPEAAYAHLREGLQASRLLEDQLCQAECHLAIGSFRSVEQSLGPALAHLDAALVRFAAYSDTFGCARARVWRARTLAALGDAVEAEIQLLQALSLPPDHLSALERGDFAFLQGEIVGFQGAWRDARRLFRAAADTFEGAGLVWRERLARLRLIQAEACEALDRGAPLGDPENPWSALESLKAPVEGSNSRWLELEWHRAHALLLSAAPAPTEGLVSEALGAWSEVQGAARELRFPALVLEASARSAALLLQRGERLGARSRLQDAHGAFQELWSRVPEAYGERFLGRPDLHRFARAVEASGLQFVVPERGGPLADWTPTQVTLSLMGPARPTP